MFGFSAFAQTAFSTLVAGAEIFGSASITANAALEVNVVTIKSASGSILGQATVVAIGSKNVIIEGNASIVTQSIVTSQASRVRGALGSVVTSSTFTGSAIKDASGVAYIDAQASASALANKVSFNTASISSLATVSANGGILGDNWTAVPITDNTWTPVAVSNNTWTEVQQAQNTWYRQG